MADIRDSKPRWDRFDEQKMLVYLETGEGDEREFPVIYTVCDVCRGTGKHVNPNIDRHGISAEEFAEDPDFAENYFSGLYDVTCNYCGGNRVIPELDRERCTPEQLKYVDEWLADEAAYRAECEAERRMGA